MQSLDFNPFARGRDGSGPGRPRTNPDGSHDEHAGRDYPRQVGEPFRSPNDYTVLGTGATRTGRSPGSRYVTVQFDDGVQARFLHINDAQVRAGQRGRAGDVLYHSGRSGVHSSPTHDHVDVWIQRDGQRVRIDPNAYFNENNVREAGQPRQPARLSATRGTQHTVATSDGERPGPFNRRVQQASSSDAPAFAPAPSGSESEPPARTDVSQVAATPAETAANAEPGPYTIADPFAISDKVKTQQDTVANRAETFDNTITQAIDTMNQIQDRRVAIRTQAVDTKSAINEDMQNQTRALIDRARPLFQRREAIAHRMTELADMSPLARMFRSATDPNYNETDLRGRDRAYQNELEALGGQWNYLTNLQRTLGDLTTQQAEGADSLEQLNIENLNQDTQLVSQSLGAANAMLTTSMGGLENQMAIVTAQGRARANTLSQMTVGQINAALETAQNGPGHAVVNGVPLSTAELIKTRDDYQQLADATQSRRLALQGQHLDLASRLEDQMIDHMSPTQIEQAIQNGGTYNGQPLSVQKLTAAYGSLRARQGQQVVDTTTNSAPAIALSQIQALNGQFQSSTQRMTNLFGALPPEQQTYGQSLTAELAAWSEGQRQANAQGIGAQWAAQNLPRLQALMTRQREVQTAAVTRWAGGNRDIQAVGEAWVAGQPLSGDAAVRGLIAMARGGMPAGTQLTGAAAQSFQRVQALVRAHDNPSAQAGLSVNQLMQGRGNATDRDRELRQQVQAAIGGQYSDRMMNDVVLSTRRLANQVRVNGQPHPFTQVSDEDFQNAVAYGDQAGYERIGQEFNLDADQTRTMFSQGPGGSLWQRVKVAKNISDDQFAVYGRRLSALQGQMMLQALDTSPSRRGNFQPSRAFVDLVNNPQFQGLVGQRVRNTQGSSFGDYLISSVAGPGFNDQFQNYATGMRSAHVTLQSETMRNAIAAAQAPAHSPMERTRLVIRAMPDVSTNEMNQLLGAIAPLVGPDPEFEPGRTFGETRGTYENIGNQQFSRIINVIRNNRLDNPQLEAIRRRVAQHWPESLAIVNRIMGIGQSEEAAA